MYNPYSLEGKTILITGASSGIGRATAIECSKLGAKCVITARNKERLQQTFESLVGDGHVQIIADLTIEDERKILVDKSPRLNGFVCNAGIAHTKVVQFINQEDLDKVFSVHTFAPVLLTKELAKKKKLENKCSIVVTSSVASMRVGVGNAVYGMAKAAIASFARSCALEFASKDIRANSIHPAMVNTELAQSLGFLTQEDYDADRKKYPLRRYANPQEIAWAIIYLLSDAAAWVTGSSLVIDGGALLV